MVLTVHRRGAQLAALAVCLAPALAWADPGDAGPPAADDEAATPLPPALEAVVPGSRAEAAPTVETVQVVRTEHAEKESADLGDVLARTEGVSVQRSGALGSEVRVGLDGLNGNEVRILVDGIPIQMSGFTGGLAAIPLAFVQEVDVYSGVVPTRLAADALGGVINVVTQHGIDGNGAEASEEFGSFLTERFTAGLHLSSKQTGLYLRAFGYIDYARNDYDVNENAVDSRGRETPGVFSLFHNRYRAESFGIEAGVADRSYADRLYLRVFDSHSDQQLNSNLTMQVPFGQPYSNLERAGALLHYDKRLLDDRVSVDVTGGYGHDMLGFLDVGTCLYDWAGQCVLMRSPGETDSVPHATAQWQNSVFARANVSWKPSADDELSLTFAPTEANRTGLDRLAKLVSVDSLRGRHRLYEQVSGLGWQRDFLGGRLQNQLFGKDYLYEISAPASVATSAVLGTLVHHLDYGGWGDMLRFQPIEALEAKASYEDAIRLPSPLELFGDGEYVAPDAALRPERSQNVNLQLAARVPTLRAGTFHAELDGFARYAKDLIYLFSNGSGPGEYFNVADVRVLGAGGALGYSAPRRLVELDLNATYEEPLNTSTTGEYAQFYGELFPGQPRVFANGSVRFNWRDFLISNSTLSLAWYGHFVNTFSTTWASLGTAGTQWIVPTQFNQTVALTWTRVAPELVTTASVEVDDLAGAKLYDFYNAQRPGRAVFAKLTLQYGSSPRSDPDPGQRPLRP